MRLIIQFERSPPNVPVIQCCTLCFCTLIFMFYFEMLYACCNNCWGKSDWKWLATNQDNSGIVTSVFNRMTSWAPSKWEYLKWTAIFSDSENTWELMVRASSVCWNCVSGRVGLWEELQRERSGWCWKEFYQFLKYFVAKFLCIRVPSTCVWRNSAE